MQKITTLSPLVDAVKYQQWQKQWGDQSTLDVFSYISDQCSPEQMLVFCRLLFPDFVRVDGGVFLAHQFNQQVYTDWMNELSNDVSRVEQVMNHVHLYDVFGGCRDEVSDSVFKQLADALRLSWRLVLQDRFPDQEFCVEVSFTEQDYGPVVTFAQVLRTGCA